MAGQSYGTGSVGKVTKPPLEHSQEKYFPKTCIFFPPSSFLLPVRHISVTCFEFQREKEAGNRHVSTAKGRVEDPSIGSKPGLHSQEPSLLRRERKANKTLRFLQPRAQPWGCSTQHMMGFKENRRHCWTQLFV